MLYIIPTPIGNTQDITVRALELLKLLSIFLCEDTRTTKKLFNIYQISLVDKQFFSLTSYSDPRNIAKYTEMFTTGDVGLLSEAGTPGLSDPGKQLIEICHTHTIPYTILPGANALVPAIVSAGFDTSQFVFLGFFPAKKGKQTMIDRIIHSPIPVFFYESVHRVEKTLQLLYEKKADCVVSIARELSKMHEQYMTAPLPEVIQMIKDGKIPLKGEFVVGVRC